MDLSKISTEDLCEAIADTIKGIADREEAYQDDVDNLDSDFNNAIEEAEDKELDELLTDEVDESIKMLVEKLRGYGAEDDEIKELLLESVEAKMNRSIYNQDNSILVYPLRSYEQIDLEPEVHNVVINRESIPMKDVLEEVSARPDGWENFKKASENFGISMSDNYLEKLFNGAYAHGDLYLGEDRSMDLIVNETDFIMNSKRFIKDMKILRKTDPKRFPALTHVLAGDQHFKSLAQFSDKQIIDMLIQHITKVAGESKRWAFNTQQSLQTERGYMEESFMEKSLDDLPGLDDKAQALINSLKKYGADEDEIMELMLENSYMKMVIWPDPVTPNYLIGDALPEEEEFTIDDEDLIQSDNFEFEVKDAINELRYRREMWYPEFAKQINKPTAYRIPPGELKDLWLFQPMHGYVETKGRSAELVLDLAKLSMATKRFVKDLKVLKKIDPKRFPASSKLINN